MTYAPIAHQHHFEKPEKQSIGEKIWHEFTYLGVNYGANLAISLVIWDFFVSGRGKPVQHFLDKQFTQGLQSTGMHADKAASYGKTIAEMIFAPLGGHLMMIPVKFLEDHARFITHKLNQVFDSNYKYKDLQATMSTPETDLPPLSDEPSKQTWGQIAMRRGMGWGSVVAAGTALTKLRGGRYRNILQSETEDFVTWGMKETSKATSTTALTSLAENETFKRYLNLAALDAYFTVITSSVTEATKSWFSKDGDQKKEEPKTLAPLQTPTTLMQPASIASHHAPMLQKHDDLVARASFVDALNKQGSHSGTEMVV